MAHKIYDNFYLSNEIEDQFNSHLDLQQFCTVDISLIVSEETGTISVAREGHLTRHLDRAGLEQVLTSIYQQKETGLLSSLLEKTKRRKGDAA